MATAAWLVTRTWPFVFFRRPSTLEEERMYRSVICQIVDRRGGGEEESRGGRAVSPSTVSSDNDDFDGDGDGEFGSKLNLKIR
jgi:hypothetical protein